MPDGQSLALTTTVPNDALVVTWTPARAGGAGRVRLSFEIAHHAGIAAELDCDVPDTGTARVPGALLDELVAQGTAGFPGLTVTRVSADTATIPPGCVEFAVTSSVAKPISVETVTSCSEAPSAWRRESACPRSSAGDRRPDTVRRSGVLKKIGQSRLRWPPRRHQRPNGRAR